MEAKAEPDPPEPFDTFDETNPGIPDHHFTAPVMHKRYGGLARRFFERFFGPIDYPQDRLALMRDLAGKGVLVYVTRTRSTMLALYFNHALSRLGLPLPRFVGGVSVWMWQPWGRSLRLTWQRLFGGGRKGAHQSPNEIALSERVLAGQPAFIALEPRYALELAPPKYKDDYFKVLVATQRKLSQPIFVVPHVMVDRGYRQAEQNRRWGLGPAERLRQFRLLVTTSRHATVRVGDPINLQRLIEDHPDESESRLARRVRHDLNKRIDNEVRVVAGPELVPYQTTVRRVVRDARLRETLETMSEGDAGKLKAFKRAVRKNLSEIAARYSVPTVKILDAMLHQVFNRIYDGLVIDQEGLQRVVAAARKGPLVFTPSHRSHVDYLVLSYILWRQGVTPPHIAAGANLSFFPLGIIFRRAGAFFLRRTIRDDKIYAATFRAYLRELIRCGTSIEFFPEGTRTRTGKLLMPRFGLMSMVVDAWRTEAREDVVFVPMSIDYERIIESGSYERELSGEKKKKEDIAGLLKSTKVLRSRYGRVHIQFGQPVSLKQFAEERGLNQSFQASDHATWRREVERLSFRVMYEIAAVAAVTPVGVIATTLLGHRGRGMASAELQRRAEFFVTYLDTAAARLTPTLVEPSVRQAALDEAVESLVSQKLVQVDRAGRGDAEAIYHIGGEHRISLNFYKNALMNHFAPTAIIARSLVRHEDDALSLPPIREAAQFLSQLFKREFFFRTDDTFETYFDDALASLAVRGFVDVLDDDSVQIVDREALTLLSSLLDGFVEAYWVTAKTLREVQEFPLWDDELRTRALEQTRRAYLLGEIRRPEAANRTLIDTAVGWMANRDVIAPQGDGERKPWGLHQDCTPEQLEALIAQIASFVE